MSVFFTHHQWTRPPVAISLQVVYCGITPAPPMPAVLKYAGDAALLPSQFEKSAQHAVKRLQQQGFEARDQSKYFSWVPNLKIPCHKLAKIRSKRVGMIQDCHLLFQLLPGYRCVYLYPAGNTAPALMVPAWYLIHVRLVNSLPMFPKQTDNVKVIPRYLYGSLLNMHVGLLQCNFVIMLRI